MSKENAIGQVALFKALVNLGRPGFWEKIGNYRVAFLTIELVHKQTSESVRFEMAFPRAVLFLKLLKKKGCFK